MKGVLTKDSAQWTLAHWGWDKMDAISQTTFSNAFSWKKNFEFRLKFHWRLFSHVQLQNIPTLVQKMDCRLGDKPLSEFAKAYINDLIRSHYFCFSWTCMVSDFHILLTGLRARVHPTIMVFIHVQLWHNFISDYFISQLIRYAWYKPARTSNDKPLWIRLRLSLE